VARKLIIFFDFCFSTPTSTLMKKTREFLFLKKTF